MTTTTHSTTFPTLPPTVEEEYNPSNDAKPYSPFYLYNHDSPRPSTDHLPMPKSSVTVSLQDLEYGEPNLTPSVTQEKLNNNLTKTNTIGSKLMFWQSNPQLTQCKTKPKQKWLKSLPKRQRLIVKLVIAALVVGCMVGVAVGIAVGLKSTVWKSDNQQGKIGK